ncbi:armadillo repeat-containing protein 4 armc4 [Anaeramoeba flamelloides]|uniref:Armadillo repeat-containing protein 4 armc4 n=1 Tax=Anaeramoeba flamelloides TaxID=1746091 RepID=A0AAV7Z5L9_9EUKA|nr:armadillo repeat-containing protein 4 armc4 [Anaeramoeba flamelloides]
MNLSPKTIILGSIMAGSVGAMSWQIIDEAINSKGKIRKISKSISLAEKTSTKEFESDIKKLNNYLLKVKNPKDLNHLFTNKFFEILGKIITESTRDTEQVKSAISILQVISQNEKYCQHFVRLGILEVILDKLHYNNPDSLKIIYSMIRKSKMLAIIELDKINGLDILIKELKSEESVNHAGILECLTWASEYSPKIINELIEKSCIPLLCNLLIRYHDSNPRCVSLICSVLSDICSTSTESAVAILRIGILPRILDLIYEKKNSQERLPARCDALILLSHLIANPTCAHTIFESKDLIDTIFKQYVNFNDLKVRYVGVKFLAKCAELNMNKNEISDPNKLKILIDLLNTKNTAILSELIKTLKLLSITVSSSKSESVAIMVELDILNRLIPLLSLPITSSPILLSIVSDAIVVVGNCCFPSQEAKEKVRYLHIIEKIIHLLDSTDPKIYINAVFAIANIVMDTENQKIVVAKKGLAKVVELLDSTDILALVGCTIVLRNYSVIKLNEEKKITQQWFEQVNYLIKLQAVEKMFAVLQTQQNRQIQTVVYECFVNLNNHPEINQKFQQLKESQKL